jgi:hypothetical protein
MTTDRTPAEPKRYRVSLHESKPHYFTDEDGVSHEGPPRCSGCDMRWPCDAFLLNKQLDGLATQLAEEQATNLRLMTHSCLAERYAAEAQVATLVEALQWLQFALEWAVFEEHPQVGLSNEMRDIRGRVDAALVDLSSAALAHDQRVAETAVEAYRVSLREGIRDRIVEVEADAKLPVKDRRMGTDFRRGVLGSLQTTARLLLARSWCPDCGAPPEAPCDPKCSQPDRVSVPQKERRG